MVIRQICGASLASCAVVPMTINRPLGLFSYLNPGRKSSYRQPSYRSNYWSTGIFLIIIFPTMFTLNSPIHFISMVVRFIQQTEAHNIEVMKFKKNIHRYDKTLFGSDRSSRGPSVCLSVGGSEPHTPVLVIKQEIFYSKHFGFFDQCYFLYHNNILNV